LKKEELAVRIGARIVMLREKKGWTQSDLARAMMKDRQSIDRLEKGNTTPTIYTLYSVATVLEIPLSELVKI